MSVHISVTANRTIGIQQSVNNYRDR